MSDKKIVRDFKNMVQVLKTIIDGAKEEERRKILKLLPQEKTIDEMKCSDKKWYEIGWYRFIVERSEKFGFNECLREVQNRIKNS